MQIYLPRSGCTASSRYYKYMGLLSYVPSENEGLQLAIKAVSSAQLGARHKDQELLHASQAFYGTSLGNLRRRLAHTTEATSDETFATILVLSLCEFFSSLNSHGIGWVGHNDGAKRYLQARGPKSIISPLARALYDNCRHTCVGNAHHLALHLRLTQVSALSSHSL